MKIDLHYGDGLINLEVPEKNVGKVIKPWIKEESLLQETIRRNILKNKIFSEFKKEINGRKLCILLNDGTRDTPLEKVFDVLLQDLIEAESITFILSTGTHTPNTPDNKKISDLIRYKSRQNKILRIKIHIHDCEKDCLISAGKTSRGTEIEYNQLVEDADVFLVISDIKSHYFGGYSNPVKNFIPGICSYETAEKNHSLALNENSIFGKHPWHRNPARRDNPLAVDQLEGMKMVVKGRPVYAVTTISSSGQIQWLRFGMAGDCCSEAFDLVDKMNTHKVEKARFLVVSPGGFPNDIDLYIAQRALELTKNAVKNNGQILFISECQNGIGSDKAVENFYNILKKTIPEIYEFVEQNYFLYAHKPYRFAQLIERLDKIWIYSEISETEIKAAHLFATFDPQKVVDEWIGKFPEEKINFFDGANKIAIYS